PSFVLPPPSPVFPVRSSNSSPLPLLHFSSPHLSSVPFAPLSPLHVNTPLQRITSRKTEPEKGRGLGYSWQTLHTSFLGHFGLQQWGLLMEHPCRIVLFNPNENVLAEKRTVLPLFECFTEK